LKQQDGKPRPKQIDRATTTNNNKNEINERDTYSTSTCFIVCSSGLFSFFDGTNFKGTKESKFVEKRQQNWRGEESIEDKKKMYYLRKRDDKNVDTTHTHVFLVLFPLY
jgi:hypothetical protein